jgi:hypothetical protein
MADLKPKCVIDPSTPVKFEDLAEGGKYADCEFDFGASKDIQLVLNLPVAKETKVAPTIDTTTAVDTTTLVASVAVPSPLIDIPKPPPKADSMSSMTVMTGAIAGAIGSSAGPMLANFLKSKLKSFLKSKSGIKGEEKAEEGALDCKTHNLQCNTRSSQFSASLNSLKSKVAALEGRVPDEDSLSFGDINLEDLEARITKLEKKVKKGLK